MITQTCSGSSCHSGNGREANLMSYGHLKAYVDNGQLRREVLDDATGPSVVRHAAGADQVLAG